MTVSVTSSSSPVNAIVLARQDLVTDADDQVYLGLAETDGEREWVPVRRYPCPPISFSALLLKSDTT